MAIVKISNKCNGGRGILKQKLEATKLKLDFSKTILQKVRIIIMGLATTCF